MKILRKSEVNIPNSRTWVACNDDSKSKYYKGAFLEKYGGEFIKSGRYVKWQKIQPPAEIYVPRRLLAIVDPTGKVIGIDHMTNYCIEHKLSKSALYEVLRGTRKQYKGYTAIPDPNAIIPEPLPPIFRSNSPRPDTVMISPASINVDPDIVT